ncbi:Pmp2p [Saccharomyces cerevisiae YJM1478]|uniref:Plasma membrane ATPase proteolipid 2 n=7 Tax=Saccharomyces cerevisiae TaxID=4932 RepID=PMP2_YEAST|nr:proteolipid ATPase [Saccharomyces cerevisiae S288C]P40975.1 RecName: Full=Plasma membrane ATPase proteolipid 2; Flags: Precursor [Saccharomyces cerevisiae S288C]AAB64509.1 Plasma membrane proteolipid protein [Saccharomyces cerevisiae]AHY75536.1 Pmp2p [Saccharomyces cerevisiae YJM993]AJP38250.1 Pmp2p [Saccharomyces cerevisiae YJM1078]AJU39940.1 Pmp2p [Saccharomyces cerevisiae YJM693]AJU40194.1 Pmp2p [Saccharomyces cerevisiae YJM969]AJU40449.1 Pmp2p [Saccharomyces cerevisiae YJM972]AJU4070|eukprot:NP_010898.1 proteolipid ATPase [Saccharomyces cerevisiae S288C]
MLMSTLPGGVILVFILVGLACIAIISTIIYRKWQARQRGLQRF